MTFHRWNNIFFGIFLVSVVFTAAQGIRYIDIIVEPPFEYPITYWGPYDYRWVYNLGNSFHVNSKPSTVNRFVPFEIGDTVGDDLACETARRLRETQFFGEATVEIIDTDSGRVAVIIVQDLWTTKLSPSMAYEGRVYEWAVEFEEVNLLGYGVGIRGGFRHDEDYDSWFSGLKLSKVLPFHSDLSVYYSDATKSIGPTQTSLAISRDRRRDCDPLIWRFGGYVCGGEHTTWQDGHIQGADYTIDDQSVYGGAKYIFGEKIGLGAGLSYSSLKREKMGGEFPDFPQEYHREVGVLSAGLSYVERRYFTARDVDAFGITEDIPFGVSIGLEGGAGPEGMSPYGRFSGTFGFPIGPFFSAFSCHALKLSQTESYSASFRFFSDKFFWSRIAGRLFYGTISNESPESFYHVGGQTCLRSYPTNMQVGNRTIFGNLEYRLFTPYEFFSIRVGACAFVDFGTAWDASRETYHLRDLGDKIVGDYGIELRFGSTSSTTGQVFRASIARTFDNLWEFELSSGQLFNSYLNLDHRVPLP